MTQEFVFGRISLTMLTREQNKLLKMLGEKKIDNLEFIRQYNLATLGLVSDKDQIIKLIYQVGKLNEHKTFLKAYIPILLNSVLSRALKYYGEVGKYYEREPPTQVEDRIKEALGENEKVQGA